MLEIAVDPGRLYYSDDERFLSWFADVLQRVARQRKRENEKQKRQSRRKR
jgi:hypothetical protein